MNTVRLIDMPYSELHPTLKALSDAGVDAVLAEVIRKPGNADIVNELLRAKFLAPPTCATNQTATNETSPAVVTVPTDLIGLDQQMENWLRWNTELRLGFPKRLLKMAERKLATLDLAWPTKPNLVHVVTLYFKDEWITFDQLWLTASKRYPGNWKWEGYDKTPRSSFVQLLPGIEHPGLCVRIETIDLHSNWDRKNGIAPDKVRNPKTSPHAGLLAAAALFPDRVKKQDGVNEPYWWDSGYQVTVPGDSPWSFVPILLWLADDRKFYLDCNLADGRSCSCSVPSLRECQVLAA